jgi:GalNAc5-diNAcBac-PP-undecaprenol beta-1,3-glucosyltransferase
VHANVLTARMMTVFREFCADEIVAIVAALKTDGVAVVRGALPADRITELWARAAPVLDRVEEAGEKRSAGEAAETADVLNSSAVQDGVSLGYAHDDHVRALNSLPDVLDLLENSQAAHAVRLYLGGEAGFLVDRCSLGRGPAADALQALPAQRETATAASDQGRGIVCWVPLAPPDASMAVFEGGRPALMAGDLVILTFAAVQHAQAVPHGHDASYGFDLRCVARRDIQPSYSGPFLPLHPWLDRRRAWRPRAAGQLRATVLIPTYRHAPTLPFAVASVLAQAGDDVEVFIVGDGADDHVRAVGRDLASGDPRVRFFDYPKGARHGEENRHAALAGARGRIVCYQSDDDLWLPNHLDAMDDALSDADFAGGIHVNVTPHAELRAYYFDLSRPELTRPWLAFEVNGFGDWASGGFGLTYAAHTLEAYRRLPEGWAPAPGQRPSQHTMWHKFARQPWCRMKSVTFATALHFPAFEREDWPPAQRAAELKHWSGVIARGDGWETICRGIMTELGERLFRQALADRSRWDEMTQRNLGIAEDLDREREKARAATEQLEKEIARRNADAAQLESERAHLERTLAATMTSTSWRMTAPLRACVDGLRHFRSRRGT